MDLSRSGFARDLCKRIPEPLPLPLRPGYGRAVLRGCWPRQHRGNRYHRVSYAPHRQYCLSLLAEPEMASHRSTYLHHAFSAARNEFGTCIWRHILQSAWKHLLAPLYISSPQQAVDALHPTYLAFQSSLLVLSFLVGAGTTTGGPGWKATAARTPTKAFSVHAWVPTVPPSPPRSSSIATPTTSVPSGMTLTSLTE